jgi:hypothetical protein
MSLDEGRSAVKGSSLTPTQQRLLEPTEEPEKLDLISAVLAQ